MQLKLPWTAGTPGRREVCVGGRGFPVEICRRRGARRYVVRVTGEGTVRITVPYGAPIAKGLAFAETQGEWILREWQAQRARAAPWVDGTPCWFRGERVPVRLVGGRVRLGELDCGSSQPGEDLRAVVFARLRALAGAELRARCRELAASAGLTVRSVSVRNQRTRWGACSTRGTITLNWRLVQMSERVRDYVIWHELAHLTVPNHSRRFWREVERLCPTWREDEQVLASLGVKSA